MEIALLAGFGGGLIRGLVGFIKHQYSYKEVPFELPYFLTMMVISGTIGGVAVFSVRELGMSFLGIETISSAMALIIGYAGGDFLENIYKIILKKPTLFKLPSNNGN
ncbi:MAG TPA: hypothetical protein ENI04_00515 [Candidatus Wildermuthbacteria bacterium]|nr:hypothetical protein [Patescibacteria group bacterium]HEA84453.1 hypothetical protein [Candidatus Wildermuthbacteria bacterium]